MIKKGKIKVYGGYTNECDVVEKIKQDSCDTRVVFVQNETYTEYKCSSSAVTSFLEKYKLELVQLKCSYDNVLYDVEIDENTHNVTKICIDETQLQNFVKVDNLKLYKIPVSMEYCGFIQILGTSLINACDRAYDDQSHIPNPCCKGYVDGSFIVAPEEVAECYNDENGAIELEEIL